MPVVRVVRSRTPSGVVRVEAAERRPGRAGLVREDWRPAPAATTVEVAEAVRMVVRAVRPVVRTAAMVAMAMEVREVVLEEPTRWAATARRAPVVAAEVEMAVRLQLMDSKEGLALSTRHSMPRTVLAGAAEEEGAPTTLLTLAATAVRAAPMAAAGEAEAQVARRRWRTAKAAPEGRALL